MPMRRSPLIGSFRCWGSESYYFISSTTLIDLLCFKGEKYSLLWPCNLVLEHFNVHPLKTPVFIVSLTSPGMTNARNNAFTFRAFQSSKLQNARSNKEWWLCFNRFRRQRFLNFWTCHHMVHPFLHLLSVRVCNGLGKDRKFSLQVNANAVGNIGPC